MHKDIICPKTKALTQSPFHSKLLLTSGYGGSRKETDMRELPVVEDLRARVTDKTADQRFPFNQKPKAPFIPGRGYSLIRA